MTLDSWGHESEPLATPSVGGVGAKAPASSLITKRTTREEKRGIGRASSGMCPKAGYVGLSIGMGPTLVCETTCKTWRCLVCRRKNLQLFKMKVAHGCSVLGACVLITLTLNAQRGTQQDGDEEKLTAQYVGMEWRRFLYRLKKSCPKLAWIKVTQLTKAGIPHLHVVMGGLNGRKARCEKDVYKDLVWSQAKCSSDCLEHEISRHWFEVTGDSWVVDCRPVVGSAGAGAYIGRYLATDFTKHERLVELGYSRRYNRSLNWPHTERMEFAATQEGRWTHVGRRDGDAWKYGEVRMDSVAAGKIWPRVGTEMAQKYELRARKRAAFKRLASFSKIGEDERNGDDYQTDTIGERDTA
jgi:hypothetical protein